MDLAPSLLPPWLLPLLVAPIVGSFLGVLILRLPAGEAVAWARSACGACGRVLSPAELVPFASFVWLRGRCRGCGSRIGWFHPAVELAALAVAMMAVAAGGTAARLWEGCVLGWTLLALGWIDARTFLLPDVLTLPLVLAGLAAGWLQGGAAALDAALGAAAGFLGLRLVGALYRALRGSDGLGGGDAKLLAAGGAWLGVAALPGVLFLAACLGIVLALAAGRRRISATMAVPFGPPLAAAIWLAWLWPGLLPGG